MAILRDTSMSMAGLWAEWSSSLCTSVVELAKRKRMGVGYIEFNTDCDVYAFPPNGGCSKRESGWNRRDRGIAGRRELREKTEKAAKAAKAAEKAEKAAAKAAGGASGRASERAGEDNGEDNGEARKAGLKRAGRALACPLP